MVIPVAMNVVRRFGCLGNNFIEAVLLRSHHLGSTSSSSSTSCLPSAAFVSTSAAPPTAQNDAQAPATAAAATTVQRTTPRRPAIVWEPDDVGLPPEVAPYESLCVEMKGYDFVLLEKFARYVHTVCRNLGHTCEGFAMPGKSNSILTYRPNSNVIDNVYDLTLYERDVFLPDLPNTELAPLISLFTSHLPEGVTIKVRHHTDADEEIRYIPDRQLKELHGQLDVLSPSRKK